MIKCLESVEGCADCQAEADYQGPHECASDNKNWSTSCEVFGRMKRESESFHQITHLPSRCDACKAIVRNNLGYDVLAEKSCRAGYCRRIVCPYCDHEWSSDGPVGCPSCCPLPRPARIRRMHSMYSRRRR